MFLKISLNSQENTSVGVSYLIKLQVSSLQLYYKETPTQVLSCEFCQFFKSAFFVEYIGTAASDSRPDIFCKRAFLKNFENFTRKNQQRTHFLTRVLERTSQQLFCRTPVTGWFCPYFLFARCMEGSIIDTFFLGCGIT